MKYECKIYYSGYVSVRVKGDNKDDALEQARAKADVVIAEVGLPPVLKPWKECDEVEEV